MIFHAKIIRLSFRWAIFFRKHSMKCIYICFRLLLLRERSRLLEALSEQQQRGRASWRATKRPQRAAEAVQQLWLLLFLLATTAAATEDVARVESNCPVTVKSRSTGKRKNVGPLFSAFFRLGAESIGKRKLHGDNWAQTIER